MFYPSVPIPGDAGRKKPSISNSHLHPFLSIGTGIPNGRDEELCVLRMHDVGL